MRKLIVLLFLLTLVGVGVYWGLRKNPQAGEKGLGAPEVSRTVPEQSKARSDSPSSSAPISGNAKVPQPLVVSPKARPDDAAQLQQDWKECRNIRGVLEETLRNKK
jgi:hypothetical protein